MGLTPGLGFQVARPDVIKNKRAELEDFIRLLARAREWSQANVRSYADTLGRLTGIAPEVAFNWLERGKIRLTSIDNDVIRGEQQTIDLYHRAGLIKKRLDANEILDRSFSESIESAPP